MFKYINDLRNDLILLKDEVDSCNEGSLTDDVFNMLISKLNHMESLFSDYVEIYEIKHERIKGIELFALNNKEGD